MDRSAEIARDARPPCTVVIPAYNEEAVIGRCLAALLKDAPDDHRMEIIVAANGCIDRTVAVARAAAPDARVLDLPSSSKTTALNAANKMASHFPRIYLDADIECGYGTVMAMVEALGEPGAMTASPAIQLNLEGADAMVRAYYRTWMKQPYAVSGNGGAGCYGLSREGYDAIGDFPAIVGDDIWIHTRFSQGQKRYVTHDRSGRPVFTIVRPPRHAFEQVQVEARRQAGNAEVLRDQPGPHTIKMGGPGALRSAREAGVGWSDLGIFIAMKAAARLMARFRMARGRGGLWSRDQSSRQTT